MNLPNLQVTRPQPKVKPIIGEKDEYQLVEEFYFTFMGEGYIIPVGFRSDGASIPRPLWPIVGSPFSPKLLEAAFVHDYLYRNGYDRYYSDCKFREILIANRVNKSRAEVMFKGVRAFGWIHHKEKDNGGS